MWLVSRYEDVSAMLKSPDISKRLSQEASSPLDLSMVCQDPPDHTRMRNLVSHVFTPRRVKELEQRIAQITCQLLDGVAARRSMDFIADFALPLPVTVISELLGVPDKDRDQLHRWSSDIMLGSDLSLAPEESGRLIGAAIVGMSECFERMIEVRRDQPTDDVISALVGAHDGLGKISGPELIGTCMLLLIAGHETTVNLLGNGLFSLLKHPVQFDLLKQQPDLINSAIEEMLRYESPIQQGTFRVTTTPIEVGGQPIGCGEQIVALIGAANRDPEQFENPEDFDIKRTSNKHLGFGLGIHFCLGAALARAEAKVAFGCLLERFPQICLAEREVEVAPKSVYQSILSLFTQRKQPAPPSSIAPISWRQNPLVRGLNALPVEW